jgi:hypothetical protein
MKKVLIIACLSVSLFSSTLAQGFTNSNLPIVIISTNGGVEIPDKPRVLASMKIIYRGPGQRNYVADQSNSAYLNYNGRIDIEIRGSSSQFTPKKQYGLSTKKADNISNNNVSLLDMPDENDWILNGMVFDPALIRDYLTYNLSRQIGEYASGTAYCELIINGTYKGLYVLQEKIKADDNRVNIINNISNTDNYLPNVSGGYITKADKTTGGDPIAWTMNSWRDSPVSYIHDLPKPYSVTPQQNDYIHNQFLTLETQAYDGNISVANGFSSIIDIPSFINYILINELASNVDAYMFSSYFHKDRNGKLRAGPIWDNDLTYGNDLYFWGFDRSKTDIWQFSNGDNEGSRFWWDLFNNTMFRCYLTKRWNELTQPGQPLNLSGIETFIDQTVATISEAVAREYTLWGTAGDHSQRIADIKSFLSSRIAWITAYLGSYAGCTNVPVPPLVITKIMYHQATTLDFPDSDELEFIEILNNGDQFVDLTGIYFSRTGLVYQFPVNSTLDPRASLMLASNATVFQTAYNIIPFGQFTRHLSNKSEQLVLADGFGNEIDKVHYYDNMPWPDADGNGYYLKLPDPDTDNNLAANWIAANDIIVSDNIILADIALQLYPNPVDDILNIQAGAEIRSVSLSDIQGRLLISLNVNRKSYELDMSRFNSGTYIIRIMTADKIFARKIVKN